MTPEQQRIAIAEACGWKVHPKDRFIVIPPNAPHSVQPLHTLPDYLNDLNAMHEAEKLLIFSTRQQYYQKLVEVVSGFIGVPEPAPYRVADIECCRATAAQRAEAFLRTLNLWNDEA
jgi:hypothetical protein